MKKYDPTPMTKEDLNKLTFSMFKGNKVKSGAPMVDVLSAAMRKDKRPRAQVIRKFHLGDILAVVLEYAPLSPEGNEGAQRIIGFETDATCPDLKQGDAAKIGRLRFRAKTDLIEQFEGILPLDALKESLEELKKTAARFGNSALRRQLIAGWVKNKARIHGEWHSVIAKKLQ